MPNSSFDESVDRPLFGETTLKDKLFLASCSLIPTIISIELLIASFLNEPRVLNIITTFFILLLHCSHLFMIKWYKEGELDPKFRKLIFINSAVLTSLIKKMPKKKAPKDLPLMIDSAQQTDMRITTNGNVVKSNSKLYTFYDYRDKVKKNAETSTAFYKPKINKKSMKVKFDDEDSSDSESSSKYSKNNSIKLSPKKTQLMKNVNKIYIEEDSYDQSDNGEDYDRTFIPKGKKILHLKESPEKEEVQILYVKNSIPEVSIIPNSSQKYLYQPTIKPLVMPTPTIFAKTPSLVQLAPMQQSIQALPLHSPIKYNTIKRNSAFK